MLAKQAEVSRLWLTHFSPALLEPELYLQNASKWFQGAELGEERKTISLLLYRRVNDIDCDNKCIYGKIIKAILKNK